MHLQSTMDRAMEKTCCDTSLNVCVDSNDMILHLWRYHSYSVKVVMMTTLLTVVLCIVCHICTSTLCAYLRCTLLRVITKFQVFITNYCDFQSNVFFKSNGHQNKNSVIFRKMYSLLVHPKMTIRSSKQILKLTKN